MDLGAFLRLKTRLAVVMAPVGSGAEPARGLVTRRGERLSWTCPVCQPAGRELKLTIELPGFRLGEDGALRPAGPDDTATVELLGEVKGCRFWKSEGLYVLRLRLLGRLWP